MSDSEKIEKIEKSVQKIEGALLGNPEYKQPGLIDEVKKNSSYRKKGKYVVGGAAGFGAGMGYIWDKIVGLFTT